MKSAFTPPIAFAALLVFFILLTQQAFATHIKAGEITARRLDPQSFYYEITLTAYSDRSSQVIFGSNGTLNFGDGTIRQFQNTGDPSHPDYIPRVAIDENTWKYELKLVHRYPSARSYTISFTERFRNEGILNMDNSISMPFYIETVIVIDPFLGVNNTPVLLVPPVDKAAVGKIYIHNPGAYDVDGDSISYRLVLTRQDRNTPVANYRFPHKTFPEGDPRNGTNVDGGPPLLTLDPYTGDLVWNTPGTIGEYNIAFYIEEWRKVNGKFYQLGYVTRDMQILVEDTDNNPPVIEPPLDICVVAGEVINAKIGVSDPDNDNVDFFAYSGVFNLGATLNLPPEPKPNPKGGLPTPFEASFTWPTECNDVRAQPYQVVFKAIDKRGVSLTDIKTWNIRVVGPQPVIKSLTPVGSRNIEVNFDKNTYACRQQANAIQVWRREGSADIKIDTCITGMPPGYGYQLVDVRGMNNFPFVDNGGSAAGLKPGATYCYRIVALFPRPGGGESLVSEEVCVTLPSKAPLITNVSILETDETTGRILVKWIPGPDLEVGEVQQPYQYDLYRAEGFAGGTYTLIASNLEAQQFTDTGLDTKNRVYNYYVMLKDAQGEEFESSSSASSVRIEPTPGIDNITLNWQAQVPWSNSVQAFPFHELYRNNTNPNNPEEFNLIARVDVLQHGFTYTDNGTNRDGSTPLSEDIEYCYYVVTAGSYSNPKVPEPLLNNSQRVCSYLRDEEPPCPPLTFELTGLKSCEEIIKEIPCGEDFVNTLVWSANTDAVCGDDFDYWLISYSANGQDFEPIAEVDARTNGVWQFEHHLTGTMAGFYYIQAVDRSGNLSEPSNIVMRDNCPNYWLPNVITRDDDPSVEDNDVLRPPYANEVSEGLYYRCPRFVEAVKFRVYNRWGKQVYEYNSATAPEPDIYIRWDGRTSGGDPVTNGTYFYVVEVTYNTIDPGKRNQSIKGWVYIVDGRLGPGSDTQ